MDEYLTVTELSARIKLSRQTIYNKISNKTFILNHHYLKPSPKKILFIWSTIHEWLYAGLNNSLPIDPLSFDAKACPSDDAKKMLDKYISI